MLFNTEKFKKRLFEEIEEFDETYKQAENEHGSYDPEKHAEILGIDVEKIHDAIHHAEECLYEDVEKLEEVPERFEKVIVSRGDPHFQSEKIEQSGVLEYVKDYIVVEHRPKDDGTDIDFLVDDAEVEHERVDLPDERTFLFDRSKHTISDFVKRLRNIDE